MNKNGIDVSEWQGVIDWNKVKNDDIDFVILRLVVVWKELFFQKMQQM